MANIKIDDSQFKKGIKAVTDNAQRENLKALDAIAKEIVRLSVNGPPAQVPHNKGILQGSATVEMEGESVLVGFNTEYAARLHEHPEYKFQKSRKGKYLEDPIKDNHSVLLKAYTDIIKGILKI